MLILTLELYSASNILDATPGLLIIPAPTTDNFATSLLYVISLIVSLSLFLSRTSNACSRSSEATVKEISFVPSRPTDCKIISTLMLLAASVSNTLKAVPGLSSTPITEILAVFLSAATPVTYSFSIPVPSPTTVPSV